MSTESEGEEPHSMPCEKVEDPSSSCVCSKERHSTNRKTTASTHLLLAAAAKVYQNILDISIPAARRDKERRGSVRGLDE